MDKSIDRTKRITYTGQREAPTTDREKRLPDREKLLPDREKRLVDKSIDWTKRSTYTGQREAPIRDREKAKGTENEVPETATGETRRVKGVTTKVEKEREGSRGREAGAGGVGGNEGT